MSTQQTTLVRWFWWPGWHPERLESWLEELAAQGWHLVKADRLLLRFHFVKGPKKRVRVCVDFQTSHDLKAYEVLFQDAGWELMGTAVGYYVWRAEYEGADRPEIYSDLDSLIQRNNRLLLLLSILTLAQVPAWLTGALNPLRYSSFGGVLVGFYFVCLLISVFGVVATAVSVYKLRSRRP